MSPEEKQQNYALAEKLLSEQRFSVALAVGGVTSIVATAGLVFALSSWAYAYGFAVIAVGILIGYSMQITGRGIERKFSIAAALLTLLGCFLGRAAIYWYWLGATQREWPETLGRILSAMSIGDLFFWLVAIWFAVFLVKRPLARAERLAIGLYRAANPS